MNIVESTELMKKHSVCPECGNDKIGGNPSQGSLIIEDEVFTRSCKCGWKVIVDRRIKHKGTLTKHYKKKLIGGVYEVSIHENGRKLLPLLELIARAGVTRVNQHAKIEEWLNSDIGRKWALEVVEARAY